MVRASSLPAKNPGAGEEAGPPLRVVRHRPLMNPLELEFHRHLRRVRLSPVVQQSIMCPTLPAAKHHRGGSCKPDFMWPQKRVALFLDGCYWHECSIHNPNAHGGLIAAKDAAQIQALTDDFWLVLRYWEHDRDEFADIAEEVRDTVQSRPREYRRTYQIHRDIAAALAGTTDPAASSSRTNGDQETTDG